MPEAKAVKQYIIQEKVKYHNQGSATLENLSYICIEHIKKGISAKEVIKFREFFNIP